jgi:hypothetical protein
MLLILVTWFNIPPLLSYPELPLFTDRVLMALRASTMASIPLLAHFLFIPLLMVAFTLYENGGTFTVQAL